MGNKTYSGGARSQEKMRIIEILDKYKNKFFENKMSSLIQVHEFDQMICEILNEKIKCKFENMQGYCKHRKNKSFNQKYGMKCIKNGCPYYSLHSKVYN